MTTISAQLVNQLREKTGAGLMDCKKALVEAAGSIDEAVEIIKKKGLKIAAAKSSRDSKEARIFVKESADFTKLAVVQISSETDFVALNENFQKFGQDLAEQLFKHGEDYWAKELEAGGKIHSLLLQKIQELGENIKIIEGKFISGKYLGYYLHNTLRLLTVVEADVAANTGERLFETLKDLSMHIAANRVEALHESDIPEKLLQSEIAMFEEKAKDKPKEIKDKVVAGQVQKFKREILLGLQPFLKDQSVTVDQWIKSQEEALKLKFEITKFYKIVV